MKKLTAALAGASAFALLAGLAPAQAPADPAAAAEEGQGVEEITVTAQRRAQRLQRVPVAVSAFNEQAIERLNARDLRDLTGQVPNLILSEISIGPSLSQVSLRGVNSQDPEKSFDPAVGVFVDNVYLGTSAFNLLDSFDLERVEVLRGPQGTLFGRNTTGGAIQAFRTKPTGELGGRFNVVAGSDGRLDVKGVLNAPLVQDKLAFKASGYYLSDDGVFENRAGGATGAKDKWGASLSLLWSPSDSAEIVLTYDRAEDDSELVPYIPRGIATLSRLPIRITGTPPVQPSTVFAAFGPDRFCTIAGGVCAQNDFSFSTVTDPHFLQASMDAVTLNAEFDVGNGLTVNGTLGWRRSDESVFIDFDGTNRTIFNVARFQDYEQWSGELRVASNWDGWFNFVAGVFHFSNEYQLRQAIKLDNAMVAPIPALGISFTNGSGDEDQHEATTTAIYAQGDFELADGITLILGARATWDDKTVFTRFVGAPPGVTNAYRVTDGILPGRPITSQGGASADWFVFTPKVGLNWQVDETTLVYASYTRGYNAGGFSARAGTVLDVTTPFDPEYINAYELGVKADLADRTVRINAAVFLNDYKDKHEESIQPGPPPTFTSTTVRNVAGARISGFELEATWRVTEEFRLDGSFGYLNAEYTDFPCNLSSAQYSSTPAQPAGTLIAADCSGLKLRRTPEITASLTPSWTGQVGAGTLSASATIRFIDEQYSEIFNDPRGLIPSQTFVDASVGYAFGGPDMDRFRITLFGKNLSNELDITSFTNSIVDFGALPQPRTWGVELSARF